MGEFKQSISADGSWAHPPEEELPASQMPPGPFQVTDMPSRPPVPPRPTPKTEHLLAGVAPPDGDQE